MRAIVYNTLLGNIEAVRVGNLHNLENLLKPTQSFIISDEDIEGKKIESGLLVDIPTSEKEEKEIYRAWKDLRYNRKMLLSESDWTQVPDAPVDSAAWAVYRQQLRDLPANTTDPRNVVWPEPPS
jgi:hypothetical protein